MGGHVRACRHQIDRDPDLGLLLVAKMADELLGAVGSPGELGHGIVADVSVLLLEGFLEQFDDQIGVLVGDAENERLARQVGVDFSGQPPDHGPVEGLGDDVGVEVLDVYVDLVRGVDEIDGVRARVVLLDFFARVPVDAVVSELRDDAVGRLVIDEVAVARLDRARPVEGRG